MTLHQHPRRTSGALLSQDRPLLSVPDATHTNEGRFTTAGKGTRDLFTKTKRYKLNLLLLHESSYRSAECLLRDGFEGMRPASFGAF